MPRELITRTKMTFFRNVRGRVKRIKSTNKFNCVFDPKHIKGTLAHQNDGGAQLRYDVKFPDYETAVTYAVDRKLGLKIEPPQFGHWIDTYYWKPLCIVQETITPEGKTINITQLEKGDG